jgi:large subunit ribosomal protein L15
MQGGTCGFGMRGQNARSGNSTRPGFEGGQIPLYRRLPKLKGIAGGMAGGRPDKVIVNLDTLAEKFTEGQEVSLEALISADILNISKKEKAMGLKVLGDGELPFPLTVTAHAFSESAVRKIEEAGGTVKTAPGRVKWTRAAHEAKHGKSKGKAKAKADK